MQTSDARRSCLALLLAALSGACHGARTASGPPLLPPPALAVITDLRSPESVLYDPQQDVYFISNMNGGLLAADGNGFISRVDAATLRVTPQWITGFDAPKGMAILGDALYVSDIGVVRKFDRRTGAQRAVIALPGTTLVNDLTTDGRSIFVSDTGVRPGPGITFVSTGTDSIWRITNDRAEKIASGAELEHPNGLDFVDGHLRVLTFGGDELYTLDGSKRSRLARFPSGQLDGLVHVTPDVVIASSWKGNGIFRGPADGPFRRILAGIDAPADIGYDTKRHHLLIPYSNQVTIHHVE